MKERSIHEFTDKQGLKRRVIHAPGALESWEKETAKLSERRATEIEGFLIHYVYKKWQKLRNKDIRKVKLNWESENAGESK